MPKDIIDIPLLKGEASGAKTFGITTLSIVAYNVMTKRAYL